MTLRVRRRRRTILDVPNGGKGLSVPRTSGPFNPNARLVPGNSVVRAPGVMANAVPRLGDLRSAAVSLSRGRLPEGSLLGGVVNTLGRALSGGRAGVPRHVAPVSPPALRSLTPNMVNQSEAGLAVRGALRRRLATSSPRRTGGSARAK